MKKRKYTMSPSTEHAQTDEAQQALDLIVEMETAAYRRATPPSWFVVSIALLTGGLVTLAVVDMRHLQVLLILGIGMMISYQSQKMGVSLKTFPMKLMIIAVMLLAPLYFGIIIIGQLFIPTVGLTIASTSAGLIFSIVVYLLSLVERRLYLRKTDSVKSK
jgi:hypothetical protein